MNGRIVFMMIVVATFGSVPAVSWRRSRSMSTPLSPMQKSTLLDLKFALCRCAIVLNPCFYGNYRMEVWDQMRKCFDQCPQQPQRCMAPRSTEAKRQENEYARLKETNFLCYLNFIPFNETYFREEIAAIKIKCNRFVETPHEPAEEPWWSPIMTTLLNMAMPWPMIDSTAAADAGAAVTE